MPRQLLYPTREHRIHPREAIAVHAERAEVCQLRLYGYLFEPLLQTADVVDVPIHLTAFAEHQGYELVRVYLERQATMPTAFLTLMDELDKLPTGSSAVVVPSLNHLTLPGWGRRDLTEQLLLVTGRPVIVAGYAAASEQGETRGAIS